MCAVRRSAREIYARNPKCIGGASPALSATSRAESGKSTHLCVRLESIGDALLQVLTGDRHFKPGRAAPSAARDC